VCDEHELDRDTRSGDEQALEEIRQLFARYRGAARHGVVTERVETPQAPAEEREEAAALVGR
jgi:aminoglycoside phosphotransferase family enzyme